jgi:hypothetical protein
MRVNWTGFIGSPGYTNLFFEPVPESDPITQATVDAARAKVEAFIIAAKNYLPTVATLTVDGQAAEIDEQTGEIQTFWNVTPLTTQTGVMAGSYVAGTGACVSWSTGGVRKGRRVRGRTFLVPLAAGAFEADGTLAPAALTALRAAATTLATDSNGVRLVVYARTPKAIIPDGGAYDVVTAAVNDKAAVLTSRRD